MNQSERIQKLLNYFLEESHQQLSHQNITQEEKKKLIRALMNVRPPKKLPEEIRKIQNEYLQEETRKKDPVHVLDLPRIQKQIVLWQGDITRLQCDAIVNAANSRMLGCFVPLHSCIDNIIHSSAGVQLRVACEAEMEKLGISDQEVSIPILTRGYNLPAKYVIHVAGPIVYGPLSIKNKEELAACYQNTLDLCKKEGLKTVAFCCISTGEFHFPNREAAEIAIYTTKNWLKENPDSIDLVVFDVFKEKDKEIYEKLLR